MELFKTKVLREQEAKLKQENMQELGVEEDGTQHGRAKEKTALISLGVESQAVAYIQE